LLANKINTIDFELAKKDVAPFLKDSKSIGLWSTDFFLDIINRMKFTI
jgi:hypothetical protein